MQPTVLTVIGTRPEVIKLAPVISELNRTPGLRSVVCATAQHRDLLDLATKVFGIVPDVDLDLMKPRQHLDQLTADIVTAVSRVLETVRPDLVLVQGDTTTAMATSLAAFYLRIPVGHVEAGLRSGDMSNPFPEEMNRRVVSILADIHFAPTNRAKLSLLREGVEEQRIHVTGNTTVDAVLQTLAKTPVPARCTNRRQILITAHRRESFGAPFESLCEGIRRVATSHPDVNIVYPVHPNPRVKEPVRRLLSRLPNVQLVAPLPYVEFVTAMRDSYIILTDSGGVQEEAPSLGKPVLVLREVTERPEAIAAGTAKLVGTDPERIARACEELLEDPGAYQSMIAKQNPYGDGHAGERIVTALVHFLGVKSADQAAKA